MNEIGAFEFLRSGVNRYDKITMGDLPNNVSQIIVADPGPHGPSFSIFKEGTIPPLIISVCHPSQKERGAAFVIMFLTFIYSLFSLIIKQEIH